jgi:hypothetical protein
MEEQKRLLESKQFVKVVEKAIRVEVMVPTVVEKIYEVDRYIERPSLEAKLELTKKERAELKRSVRIEVNEEIMELEQNVLAYQDLLLERDETIKVLSQNSTGISVTGYSSQEIE